jgi:hypothetical protein
MLRRWSSLDAVPVAGGVQVSPRGRPVVSPSGDEVAFITTEGELKVVPLGGGVARTLATGALCCTRWGTDGFVYYSPAGQSTIRRVLETGGAVEDVTTRDGTRTQGDFQILADGDVGVFTGDWTTTHQRIDVIRLSTGERKALTVGVRPYVTPTGHLVFGSVEGQILAAPFDADAMELTGPAVPVVEGVSGSNGYPLFSLSPDGSLIYVEGTGIAGGFRLAVVDLEGDQRILPLAPRFFTSFGPSWSPDGESLVFSTENQIYTYNVVLNTTPRQITFEGANIAPVYSPDGTRIAFSSTRDGTDGMDLFVKDLNDDSPPRAILTLDADQLMMQWPTDTLIVFEREVGGTGADLWMVDISDPENPEARPYLTSEADLGRIVVSPDGGLAAYRSTESGTSEIYIRSFPNAGERTVVSRGGGSIPYWSPDGRTLYYSVGPGGRPYVAARLQREPVPAVLSLDTLFVPPAMVEPFPGPGLHPDGDRFIFSVTGDAAADGEATAPQRIILVQNFFEELKRLVPN